MKRVLVTPLDWGLGHATRCIPVIQELREHDCEVVIAGSGDALELLRREFPGYRYHSLPAYAPKYPLRHSMVTSMVRQLPHFVSTINAEHRAIGEIIRSESIDLIISDNRYGCWSDVIPSVFVTHQPNVLMPASWRIWQAPVRTLHERLIRRFRHVWIPDLPGDDSLAGDLNYIDDSRMKVDVSYIGWLSRFEPGESSNQNIEVLAVLSGPEPQRTALENLLVPQLQASGLTFGVVRGVTSGDGKPMGPGIVDFMTSAELRDRILSSALVIARSGYSTVMDLHALGKRAIFIPTPGQTEQEYLAARLMERGIAYSMPQAAFDLPAAMRESKKYPGFSPSKKNHLLGEAVRKILNTHP